MQNFRPDFTDNRPYPPPSAAQQPPGGYPTYEENPYLRQYPGPPTQATYPYREDLSLDARQPRYPPLSQPEDRRTSGRPTSTLFVGDLSYVCNEERLRELFSAFGHIDSIHLKKSDINQHRAHLSYGFVKFSRPEEAQVACEALHGKQFLGRKLRLGFAEDYNPLAHTHQPFNPANHLRGQKKELTTAQVYVSFATNNVALPISELIIREVFSQFGPVDDVVIKQVEIKHEMGVQSGYGFVHYPLTDEGIEAAVQAVTNVNQQTFNSVRYQCRFSHELKKLLPMPFAPGPARPPPPMAYPPSTYAPPAPRPSFMQPNPMEMQGGGLGGGYNSYSFPPQQPQPPPRSFSTYPQYFPPRGGGFY